jgi:WD40 repeat protein
MGAAKGTAIKESCLDYSGLESRCFISDSLFRFRNGIHILCADTADWSPDGSTIVFVSTEFLPIASDIYTICAD